MNTAIATASTVTPSTPTANQPQQKTDRPKGIREAIAACSGEDFGEEGIRKKEICLDRLLGPGFVRGRFLSMQHKLRREKPLRFLPGLHPAGLSSRLQLLAVKSAQGREWPCVSATLSAGSAMDRICNGGAGP